MSLTYSVPEVVLSTALQNARKKIEDNIFRANPLAMWLVGKYPDVPNSQSTARGQKMSLDGGESIVIPLLYERNSTVSTYSGYGQLDTTPQEGITSARYTWKQLSGSISISGREEMQNAGSTRIINLLETKIKQTEMSITEELDSQWMGTGTDSSTDFLGLQTIVTTTGTVGGIARSGNSWWQAKVATSAGSFAANGLDLMRTKYNDVSKGNDHPDLIITDQTNFERYEKTLQPQERFASNEVADGGFQNLAFKKAVMMFDLYAPSGYMYFLNSKYLNWVVHSGRDFATTEFVKPENQDAKVAQILVMGELTCSNCSRQGVIQGFTA